MKGNISPPHSPIEQEDLQRIFNEYLPKTLGENIDTEVLLHKVFFNTMYYTSQYGKEGLRKLPKNSFAVKTGLIGQKFIEITFNEKTKKNQED